MMNVQFVTNRAYISALQLAFSENSAIQNIANSAVRLFHICLRLSLPSASSSVMVAYYIDTPQALMQLHASMVTSIIRFIPV
jgi:hypothetical protein